MMKKGFLSALVLAVSLSPFLGAAQTTLQIPPAPAPDASSAPVPPPKKSRVVWIERPAVVDKFSVDAAGVDKMWNDGLLKLTDKPDAASAWKALGVQPADVVGIKIHANGSDIGSTRVPLVDAIVRSLAAAGIPARQVIVWDRDPQGFQNTFYGSHAEKAYQVHSVIGDTGWDPKVFYVNEYLGTLIWGDFLFKGKTANQLLKEASDAGKDKDKDKDDGDPLANAVKQDIAQQTSNRSYFAKLETQTCTKIVNVPVLIDHPTDGLYGCLASLAVDSVDNNRRFQDENTNGDPAISDILDRDLFRKKLVLNVMDALVAQYAGGPGFHPEFTQSIGALYLSVDPVAIDATVLPRLEQWRADAKVVPIGPLAKHIKTADDYGIGFADPKRIDLIKVP